MLKDFEGTIRYAFRPFPRPQMHANALIAALATEAAGLQGYYWPMHYAVFRYQGEVDRNRLYDLAIAVGLDLEKFHLNMVEGGITRCIVETIEKGRQLGVRTI